MGPGDARGVVTDAQVACTCGYAISRSQAYALVRNGTLPATKVGGRGQRRVERSRLEQWIDQAHADTEQLAAEYPFTGQCDGEVE